MRILDFESIRVKTVLNVMSHPMRAGHYALANRERYSDCFVYVRSGSARYTFAYGIFSVHAGDVLYLAYKSHYDIDVSENYNVVYIDCMLEQPSDETFQSAVFASDNLREMEGLFLQTYKNWQTVNAGRKLQAFSTLYAIFSQIVMIAKGDYVPKDVRDNIEEVRKQIEQNYTKTGYNCSDLGAENRMSNSHIRRLFLRRYGVTPNRLLINMRIHRASELLRQSDLPVTAVAELSGFRSAYYFCRAFKRETGQSPTEFRLNAF